MERYKSHLDNISIGASVLCLFHCILLPLFISTLPVFGFEVMKNVYIEAITLITAMLVGGPAIWKGYRRFHKSKLVVSFFISGILVMMVSNMIHESAEEILLKCLGAVFLISAHLMNWRKSQACMVCK